MKFEDWYVAGCVALTLAMVVAVGRAKWLKAGKGRN